jgi:hypothetical protein
MAVKCVVFHSISSIRETIKIQSLIVEIRYKGSLVPFILAWTPRVYFHCVLYSQLHFTVLMASFICQYLVATFSWALWSFNNWVQYQNQASAAYEKRCEELNSKKLEEEELNKELDLLKVLILNWEPEGLTSPIPFSSTSIISAHL